MAARAAPVAARGSVSVRAGGTDYGMGLEMNTTAQKSIKKGGRAPVPMKLEEAGAGSIH